MKKYLPVRLPAFLAVVVSFLFFQGSGSQNPLHSTNSSAADTAKWAFPCDKHAIEQYTAYRTTKPPVIDGKLDEEIWTKIPRSPRFVDLVSGGKTLHDTRAAVCWDQENLYVAFWVEEPYVNAKLANHNDPIYS